LKVGQICCQIIAHYNKGGPAALTTSLLGDRNSPSQPAMWTGADDAFLDLYEVTARAIRTRWPG
jgi:hypothetical protein